MLAPSALSLPVRISMSSTLTLALAAALALTPAPLALLFRADHRKTEGRMGYPPVRFSFIA